MISQKLHFVHNFDAKLHYSIYYSLLNIKNNDKIYINDSIQDKKCNRYLGRWNFIVADKDYTCGVYYALETIRQSILSAIENNKNGVNIALVPTLDDPDACYLFNYEKEFENHIDIECLKEIAVNNESCKCETKISQRIFFKVVKPVLEEVFKKTDYKITTKVFKGKLVSKSFKNRMSLASHIYKGAGSASNIRKIWFSKNTNDIYNYSINKYASEIYEQCRF